MGTAALALWLALGGYWLLYHGVHRLAALGGSGTGGAVVGRDPWAYLRQQPVIAA